MKTKILSIALFLIALTSNAQVYSNAWSHNDKEIYPFVSFAVDARHALAGSPQTDNKPSLDFIGQIGANYKGVEVGLEYEDHSALKPKFQRYGVFVNYGFEVVRDLSVYSGVTYGSIIRQNNSNFLTVGGNLELRYRLSNTINIGVVGQLLQRRDIDFLNDTKNQWRGSTFVKLQFRLN